MLSIVRMTRVSKVAGIGTEVDRISGEKSVDKHLACVKWHQTNQSPRNNASTGTYTYMYIHNTDI